MLTEDEHLQVLRALDNALQQEVDPAGYSWEREDLCYTYSGIAEKLGWTPDRKGDTKFEINGKLPAYFYGRKLRVKCSGDTHVYRRPGKCIWYCRSGWACAEITHDPETGYTDHSNHRYYPTLREAFTRES